MSKYLLDIVGPTASGKTSLSLFIAKRLDAEIISCDSRQFYREMKIGTASPSVEELSNVKHHFIGHISIHDRYSAGIFEKEALEKIDNLHAKNDFVVMVGGSGLYERAILEGLDSFPKIPVQVKDKVRTLYEKGGLEILQASVFEVDPEYYKEVDRQNARRLMRALEVYETVGEKYSEFRKSQKKERPFQVIRVGVDWTREKLYERINNRVDLMVDQGLFEEAQSLYSFRHLPALQTVGYQEVFAHLDGNFSIEFAISEIKKNSRRYAKRQMTWYRKYNDVEWFPPKKEGEVLGYIKSKISKI